MVPTIMDIEDMSQEFFMDLIRVDALARAQFNRCPPTPNNAIMYYTILMQEGEFQDYQFNLCPDQPESGE